MPRETFFQVSITYLCSEILLVEFSEVLCVTLTSKQETLGIRRKSGKGFWWKTETEDERYAWGHVWIVTRITRGSSMWLSPQPLGHFRFCAVPISAILTRSYWKITSFLSHSARTFIICWSFFFFFNDKSLIRSTSGSLEWYSIWGVIKKYGEHLD